MKLSNAECGFFRRWRETFEAAGLFARPMLANTGPQYALGKPSPIGFDPGDPRVDRAVTATSTDSTLPSIRERRRAAAAEALRNHCLRLVSAGAHAGPRAITLSVPQDQVDALLEALEAGAAALDART